MNILFVLYIGFDKHGPSVHLLKGMIGQCLEAGHSVRMIVRNRGGSERDIPAELQGYSNLHCDVIHDSVLEKGALVKRYLEDIRYAYRCRKLYQQYKDTDVVFLQSNTSPLFAMRLLKKTLKVPVLFNVQNIFPIDAGVLHKLPTKGLKGIPYHLLRKMQQMAYRMADRVVTISEDMRKTLLGEGVPGDKLRVVYNWSYDDEAVDVPDEENLFLADHPEFKNQFRVVFAGNLGAMVNSVIIADAAQKLQAYPDIRFLIIGDGNNMPKLKALAEERGLDNISFFPYQPENYARHNYAMAHVNINALPKGIITTCMPSKTATMLNAARPMVVAVERDSHYAQMLRRVDRCAVVDWDDTDGFTEAILAMYKAGDHRESANARAVFKDYCSCENAKQYVTILEQLGRDKQ